jgi:hypothetical protein
MVRLRGVPFCRIKRILGTCRCREMRTSIAAASVLLFLSLSVSPGVAQDLNRLVASAEAWDANHDHVYTCDEWKRFVTDIFNKADRNHDGSIDAQEFKAIQDSDAQFKGADFAYFDDNHDGRVSRTEFVDKPSRFFLQFDRKHTCRVTLDDIVEIIAHESPARRERP